MNDFDDIEERPKRDNSNKRKIKIKFRDRFGKAKKNVEDSEKSIKTLKDFMLGRDE